MVPGYGRDDSEVDRGGGANLVAGVWRPPERVSPEWVAAARLWMQAHEAESDDKKPGYLVSAKDLQKWMVTFVNNLMIGSGSGEADIEMRVVLLSVAVDERPAKYFSKDALKLAWERFHYIPTGHELMAFFDDMEGLERTQAQRLIAVLDAAAKPPAGKAPAVDIERSMALNRERTDRERRELARVVEERFGPPPPVPSRLEGESDDMFMARLSAHREKILGRAIPTLKPKVSQSPEQVRKAQEEFRKVHEHGPPMPPEQPEGERLAGMMADPTTEDDP